MKPFTAALIPLLNIHFYYVYETVKKLKKRVALLIKMSKMRIRSRGKLQRAVLISLVQDDGAKVKTKT